MVSKERIELDLKIYTIELQIINSERPITHEESYHTSKWRIEEGLKSIFLRNELRSAELILAGEIKHKPLGNPRGVMSAHDLQFLRKQRYGNCNIGYIDKYDLYGNEIDLKYDIHVDMQELDDFRSNNNLLGNRDLNKFITREIKDYFRYMKGSTCFNIKKVDVDYINKPY